MHVEPEDVMHKYLTELIGTFFLVVTIGLATAPGTGAREFAALAIGAMLMAMVYMGGHLSGAHYNPAVSFAVWVRGGMGIHDFIMYVLTQLFAAVLAASVVFGILGTPMRVAPPRNADLIDLMTALTVEAMFTFALALVMLNALTAKKTAANSFYGLAIGFTIASATYAAGGISGGAFNPAVGAGPNILLELMPLIHQDGGSSPETFQQYAWIYLAGPFTGGLMAGLTFRVQEAGANASE